jgi:hypothetical protein
LSYPVKNITNTFAGIVSLLYAKKLAVKFVNNKFGTPDATDYANFMEVADYWAHYSPYYLKAIKRTI